MIKLILAYLSKLYITINVVVPQAFSLPTSPPSISPPRPKSTTAGPKDGGIPGHPEMAGFPYR